MKIFPNTFTDRGCVEDQPQVPTKQTFFWLPGNRWSGATPAFFTIPGTTKACGVQHLQCSAVWLLFRLRVLAAFPRRLVAVQRMRSHPLKDSLSLPVRWQHDLDDLLAGTSRKPKPSFQAFTLIELLIVIAILAILASLLFPALSRAKASVERVGCINNLKQWGYATRLYSDENGGWLPHESAIDGINTWEITTMHPGRFAWYNVLPETLKIRKMSDYAQTPSSQQAFYARGNLFHCPAARFSEVAATYPNFSLAINSKLMGGFEAGSTAPSADAAPPTLKMAQIKAPERTVLFLDCGVAYESKFNEYQESFTGQPKAFATQFSVRHRRAGNILFVAGHVSTLKGNAVVDVDPNSAFRGASIYPPAEVVWRHDPELVP
jgi:prepilin-type N-terminal cleavage/methylation domain-containing protein